MIIVVSATGTDAGKTWLSTLLARRLQALGRRCLAVKPVESGGHADSLALADACGAAAPPLYRFDDPVGPHLAAQRAGQQIDLDACCAWVQAAHARTQVLIVELAGGLLSPLNQRQTNADLLRSLKPDAWIAVAPDRLGVLHELNALMLSVRSLGLSPPVVVLNEPPVLDPSSGTNEASLHWTATCTVGARFSRDCAARAANGAQTERLLRALGLTSAR